MKNQLAILAMGTLAIQAICSAPTNAQTEGTFYCGQAYDMIGRKKIPATLMSNPNREKPIVVILWKSDYFPEYSPQERCKIVSPKFQNAYVSDNLGYLKIGSAGNQRVVCAVKTKDEPCTHDEMLFTLKPFGDVNSQLDTLMGNIGGNAGPDITQSSGRPKSRKSHNGIVNIREFLRSAE
jgi:Circadian oscillating protein COP23